MKYFQLKNYSSNLEVGIVMVTSWLNFHRYAKYGLLCFHFELEFSQIPSIGPKILTNRVLDPLLCVSPFQGVVYIVFTLSTFCIDAKLLSDI
jgi:hypothetical protein